MKTNRLRLFSGRSFSRSRLSSSRSFRSRRCRLLRCDFYFGRILKRSIRT